MTDPTLSLGDHLRLMMPALLVRALPRRRRARQVMLRLQAGRLRNLDRATGTNPFDDGDPLFRAVDHMMQDAGDLSRLTWLARRAEPFAARVWRALCLWQEGAIDQSKAALKRLSEDPQYTGYARRAAEAWAMYLELPRFQPGPAATAKILQFWDQPDPPADVAFEIAGWRGMAEHTLLDKAQARAFLATEIGTREADLLDRCPHPAVQSDFVRLAWLMVHGGTYVDADARARPSAADTIAGMSGQTVLWCRTRSAEMIVINGLLASPPGGAFVTAAFAEACRRLSSGKEMHVFDYAGPTLCTQIALALHAEGRLDAVTVSDRSVATEILGQFDASYKRDHRNWRTWARETGHGL
ncbi:MAG: glycosyltransferase [Pseudomonadota bacterium]